MTTMAICSFCALAISPDTVVDFPPPVVPRIPRCRGKTPLLSAGDRAAQAAQAAAQPPPRPARQAQTLGRLGGVECEHRAVGLWPPPRRHHRTSTELLADQLDLDAPVIGRH